MLSNYAVWFFVFCGWRDLCKSVDYWWESQLYLNIFLLSNLTLWLLTGSNYFIFPLQAEQLEWKKMLSLDTRIFVIYRLQHKDKHIGNQSKRLERTLENEYISKKKTICSFNPPKTMVWRTMIQALKRI